MRRNRARVIALATGLVGFSLVLGATATFGLHFNPLTGVYASYCALDMTNAAA